MLSLQESISYWESQLKVTKNHVERNILDEKIKNAKKELEKSKIKEPEKVVSTIIDVNPIADRSENNTSGDVIINDKNIFIKL